MDEGVWDHMADSWCVRREFIPSRSARTHLLTTVSGVGGRPDDGRSEGK